MKETDLVRECLSLLHSAGFACWRQNTGAFAGEYKGKKRFVRFGVSGISDIIGWTKDGRFLAVECKVGKRIVTKEQAEFLRRVNAAGGEGIIVRDNTAGLLESLGAMPANDRPPGRATRPRKAPAGD